MNYADYESVFFVIVAAPSLIGELLHILMLPDLERADRIGEFWGHPETRTFAELLIDLEEPKAAPRRNRGAIGEGRDQGGPMPQWLPDRHDDEGSVLAGAFLISTDASHMDRARHRCSRFPYPSRRIFA